MLDAASMALCRRAYAHMGTRPRPSFRRMLRRGFVFGFTAEQNADAAACFRDSWLECLELAREEMSS